MLIVLFHTMRTAMIEGKYMFNYGTVRTLIMLVVRGVGRIIMGRGRDFAFSRRETAVMSLGRLH
jgi:hypothetical protein